jgi:hypothetical protein
MVGPSEKRRPFVTARDRARRSALERIFVEFEKKRLAAALALQARIIDVDVPLPPTPEDLYSLIQGRLAIAQRRGVLTNSLEELRNVFLESHPAKKATGRSVSTIIGGEKDFERDKTKIHFARSDGAWFDFAITVSHVGTGQIRLESYNFEVRFPEDVDPGYVRFDLNTERHDNAKHGARSHLHPGCDDWSVPAPIMSPLEVLDVLLFGMRPRTGRRLRRKGARRRTEP